MLSLQLCPLRFVLEVVSDLHVVDEEEQQQQAPTLAALAKQERVADGGLEAHAAEEVAQPDEQP